VPGHGSAPGPDFNHHVIGFKRQGVEDAGLITAIVEEVLAEPGAGDPGSPVSDIGLSPLFAGAS